MKQNKAPQTKLNEGFFAPKIILASEMNRPSYLGNRVRCLRARVGSRAFFMFSKICFFASKSLIRGFQGITGHFFRNNRFNKGKTTPERSINKPPLDYFYHKQFHFALILLFLLSSCEPYPAFAYTNDQLANAIYRAENSKKYPYGIKSVNTFGNENYARKICLNTIRNNRIRFSKQTEYKDFVSFLGSRFCPPKAHKLNANWVRNVKGFLNEENH